MDEQVLSIAMVYGPRVLVAIIMLAAGHFAGQWAGRVTGRSLGRYELEPPVLRLVENMLHSGPPLVRLSKATRCDRGRPV